ncbi:MAG: hypothetical protein K0R33_3836 [Mycobacterium sp.]|nr:hypothetical protein [Mycobacterium sp.]
MGAAPGRIQLRQPGRPADDTVRPVTHDDAVGNLIAVRIAHGGVKKPFGTLGSGVSWAHRGGMERTGPLIDGVTATRTLTTGTPR